MNIDKKTLLGALIIGAVFFSRTSELIAAEKSEVVGRPNTTLLDDRKLGKGFKDIFNGKDLTGWDGDPRLWSVKEGAITGETTAENPAKGNTFLIWTNGTVSDFELRCSFKLVPGDAKGFANSVIQYRSNILDPAKWVVGGYQADMEAGKTYTGILYEERMTRGIMAARGEKVVWNKDCKKEVVGSFGTSEELQNTIKQGDWNEYVVIAKGNHLQHFINGKQMVDVVDDCAEKQAMSGVLALQLHAGSPMKVQFKNLRIVMLPAVEGGASADEIKKLQGEWQITGMEREGNEIPSDSLKDVLVDIQGTAYKLINVDNEHGGTFSVDGSKEPKQMDIKQETGPGGARVLKGIYELKGDTFRVCYAQEGEERPRTFSAGADSKQVMITYQRKKTE